jgi:HK97 family phage major capsid protein
MPVPTPSGDESEQDFISRCMGDASMQEYDEEQRAAICYSTYRERSASPGGKAMRLAEIRHQRAQKIARLKELAKQEEELPEGDTLSEEEISEFAVLQQEIADLAGRLERLEAALTVDANNAEENDDQEIGNGSGDEASFGGVIVRTQNTAPAELGGDGSAAFLGENSRGGLRVWARPKAAPVEGRGYKAARFIIGVAHRKWFGDDKAAEFIFNRFKDREVATAIKALNYSVVAEGGALIPQDFMSELIELLRAATVVRGASPMTIGMPMGNMTMPRLAGGAQAGYQGELDDIALTQEVFDDLNLSAKKLTALVPVSNDLIRRAPIGVEEVVRDDLIQTLARREDLAFLRGDGLGKSPVGWRTLCLAENLVPLAGNDLAAVVDGLSVLMLTLINGLSRMIRPHWFMNPATLRFIATRRDLQGGFYYKDEIASGVLEGIPWSYTQQIPANLGGGNGSEIYLVDMADTVIADTLNVLVDASDVAAYYGTDGAIVSAFQRDQTLFRVISEHDFNMRHLQSLAIGTTTSWFPTGLNAARRDGLQGRGYSSQPLNRSWAQAPAAWPADAQNPDPAPVLWVPGPPPPVVPPPATVVTGMGHTSAFAGPLTSQPGGTPPIQPPDPPLGEPPAGEPPEPAPEPPENGTPTPHRRR